MTQTDDILTQIRNTAMFGAAQVSALLENAGASRIRWYVVDTRYQHTPDSTGSPPFCRKMKLSFKYNNRKYNCSVLESRSGWLYFEV